MSDRRRSMITHRELTQWQRDCLFEIQVSANPDSGSSAADFAYAILFALREGVPMERVAAVAGLTPAEIELRRVVNLA